MRILVTGGAGYIGSHTVLQLLEQRHNVIVVDNLVTGSKSLLPSSVRLVECNVGDLARMRSEFVNDSFDAIIHFAASTKVEESVQYPLKYYRNNFSQTVELVQFALEKKISRFVFSSTAAVYNPKNSQPILETDITDPVSPYGKSKAMCEQLLIDTAHSQPQFRPIIFRYFNVAGARLDGSIGQISEGATHLIKVACEVATNKRPSMSIFGNDYNTKDGTCERDYIHVEDLAAAHILALDLKDLPANPIFNLGYGRSYSVNEIIDTMRSVSNHAIPVKNSPRRPGDIESVTANSQKAMHLLKWKPKYDSIDMICRSAYAWELKSNLL